MGLTNHTCTISHHITPLVINALGGGHTDRQTHMHTNAQTKTILKQPGMPAEITLITKWTAPQTQHWSSLEGIKDLLC